MAVAVWGAVLGLAALLVGTLSDDRAGKLKELHEAYVGVVQVLSQYLQSANPGFASKPPASAELSQDLAAEMNLPSRQIDDIRVASLLYDMGNIEITTRVIRKAVDNFEDQMPETTQHTFHGMDLMLSLGSVLRGAIPLLLNQEQSGPERELVGESGAPVEIPVGARIIIAARDYHNLSLQQPDGSRLTPQRDRRRDAAKPQRELRQPGAQCLGTRRAPQARADPRRFAVRRAGTAPRQRPRSVSRHG